MRQSIRNLISLGRVLIFRLADKQPASDYEQDESRAIGWGIIAKLRIMLRLDIKHQIQVVRESDN